MNKRAWCWLAALLAIGVSQAPTSAAAAAAETPDPPARFARFQDAPDRTLVRVQVTHSFDVEKPALLFMQQRHLVVGTLLEIAWASAGPSPSTELLVGDAVWCIAPTEGDHVAAYGPITTGREYWLVLLREFDSVRPRIEHWTEARGPDDPKSSPGPDSRQIGAPPPAESTADAPGQTPDRRAPDRLRSRLREWIEPLTHTIGNPYDHEPREANNRVLVRAIPLRTNTAEDAVEPAIALVIREVIGIRQSATISSELSYNQIVPVAEWPAPEPPRATAPMGEHWYLLELGASSESTRVLDSVSSNVEPDVEATAEEDRSGPPPEALFSYRRHSNRALVFGEVEKVEPYTVHENWTRLAAEHAFVRVLHVEWVVPGMPQYSVDPYVFEGGIRRCQVTPKNHDPLAPPVGSLPVGTRGWFVIAGGPSGVGGILASVPMYVPD